MAALLRFARAMDRVSLFFAWIAAWLVLLSCLISAGNAASRYLFSLSSNAWLEIQWQMFSGIFLLGAAHVLKLNEHVRVDLLYGSASPRRKLWIDVIGIPLFLFPSMAVMAWFSWSFFVTSFESGEYSSNAGGLPLWPVKLLLPVGLVLLLLQGTAELIKRVAALRAHREDMVVEYERPLQ
jgi:TRAP-type mannitol/chloroaromatic compound transport system permease small subunit